MTNSMTSFQFFLLFNYLKIHSSVYLKKTNTLFFFSFWNLFSNIEILKFPKKLEQLIIIFNLPIMEIVNGLVARFVHFGNKAFRNNSRVSKYPARKSKPEIKIKDT